MKHVSFATVALGIVAVWGIAEAVHASDITPRVVNVRVSAEQSPNVGRNTIDGNLATRW